MVDNQPKVSIIMSVHNSADTLDEAIESIIDQTYTNWELIICDDGSTDSTYQVLENYKAKYPDKIILIKNETNMYLPYSLNKCFGESTGEYIARMDGDDYCAPDRFEKQVKFLNECPEYQLVGTQMQRFDKNGLHDIVTVPEKPDKFMLKKGATFCHATIMMRREAFAAMNGYRVSKMTIRSQDYDMWFRFYSCGFEGYNIQEPLYMVREDINAIKRRTLKNRINIAKIQYTGYKLLDFPKMWYFYPLLGVVKGFIPPIFVLAWRKCQQKTNKRR